MRRSGLCGAMATAVAALALLAGCGGADKDAGGDGARGAAVQRSAAADSCATVARAGALRLRSSDIDRRAIVRIPPALARRQHAAPLVIVIHGMNQDGAEYAAMPALRRTLDAAGYVAVFPDGVGGVWSFPGYPTTESYWPQERRFFEQLVDRLAALDCVNPKRIFVAGQSMGGGMATALTCVMSRQVAGFALISALHFTIPCRHAPPVPVFSVHSLEDESLPYDGAKAKGAPPGLKAIDDVVAASAQRNGCAPRPRTRRVAGGVELSFAHCRAPVVHVRLSHGEHALIGSPLTARVTRLMLRFFDAQRGSG